MKFLGGALLVGFAAASSPRKLFQAGECSAECPEDYTPVCASDGQTYDNECFFGVAACESALNNEGGVALEFTAGACGGASCAGFAGSPCDEGFECIDVVNDDCDPENGGGDCIGYCRPEVVSCDVLCTEEYDPVCASNGVTYENECFFGIAACESAQDNFGAEVLTFADGACGDASCAGFVGAACDEGFECVDVVNDDCDPENGDGDCTGYCRPVSCSDGVLCTEQYEPVCGSNGVTYENECFFGLAACEFAQDNLGAEALTSTAGVCAETCDEECSRQLDPVCASNGQTYDNECLFGVAACESAQDNVNAEILTFTDGACGASSCAGFVGTQCDEHFECIDVVNDDCDPEDGGSDCIGYCRPVSCTEGVFCTTIYEPVCGSNGVTYSNDCEFGVAACEYAQDNIGAEALTFAAGECEEVNPCEQRCTREYMPVCGSDGNTYGNECVFGVAACEFAAANPGAVALTSSEGECSIVPEGEAGEGEGEGEETEEPVRRRRRGRRGGRGRRGRRGRGRRD